MAAKKSGNTQLDAVLNQIRKEFGESAIMRMGDAEASKDIPVIPTGAFSLDLALGVGGLPRGRVVEVYGQESSGKTTLALHVIANAQKAGGLAAFVDAEHAMDPNYARRIGVDLDNLLVSQPNSGEEALTITEQLVKSGALDVVVIDSVAALTPQAEIDGNMGDAHMGLQARLMSQAMRKLTSAISQTKTLCLFTNQVRDKIGVMFGNPETTTGGNALKFYASVRIEVRRIESLSRGADDIYGNRVRIKVVKNKVSPPFKKVELDLLFGEGISYIASVLDAALKYELLDKAGSWYSYNGERIGQGREKTLDFLKDNPDIVTTLDTELRALMFPSRDKKEEKAE